MSDMLAPIRMIIVALVLCFSSAYYSYAGQTKIALGMELIAAAQNLDAGKVNSLLDRGAEINVRDKDGWTPLIWIAHTEYRGGGKKVAAVTRLLLKRGARVDEPDNRGVTPLMWAANAGNIDAIDILLAHRAKVNAKDKDGESALMWLVNWTTYDFIMGGREEQHVAIARKLVAAKADVNAQDNVGKTALIRAAWWGHLTIAEGLLSIGADASVRDHAGRSALTYCASFGKDNQSVQALQKAGARIGLVDAVLMRDDSTAMKLITGSTDLKQRGPRGETGLIAAAEAGYADVVKALLATGASPNETDDDCLPAIVLAMAGRQQKNSQFGVPHMTGDPMDPNRTIIVRDLIAAKADILRTIVFQDGQSVKGTITPLSWAKAHGSSDVVKLLVEAGATK